MLGGKQAIVCALVGLAAASSYGDIVITEVMSSSAHAGGTNNGDWFELTNTGASDVDITGWTWDDNTVTTPGNFGSLTSIPANTSVIFTEETIGAEASWKSNWGISSSVIVVHLGSTVFQGLGNPDQVNIYNATANLVATISFSNPTGGFSFEWDTSGNSLGLSAIGENGAFQAVSNGQTTGNGPGVDVGSPGLAVVPEPASLALIGLAGVAGLRRRR